MIDCPGEGGPRRGVAAVLPPMSGEGRHVLIVEDDEELRKLLLSLLRRSGFRASGARDGIEMRRLIASALAYLVQHDVKLPGLSWF